MHCVHECCTVYSCYMVAPCTQIILLHLVLKLSFHHVLWLCHCTVYLIAASYIHVTWLHHVQLYTGCIVALCTCSLHCVVDRCTMYSRCIVGHVQVCFCTQQSSLMSPTTCSLPLRSRLVPSWSSQDLTTGRQEQNSYHISFYSRFVTQTLDNNFNLPHLGLGTKVHLVSWPIVVSHN